MPDLRLGTLGWNFGTVVMTLVLILCGYLAACEWNRPAPDPSVKEDVKALRAEMTAGFKTLGDKLGKGQGQHGSSGAMP